MQYIKIPLQAASGLFPRLFIDYIGGAPTLTPFYHRTPTLASFEAQIADKAKAFSTAARRRLGDVLATQYGELRSAAVDANLAALQDERAFTVTTGHQLNFLTGPLYVIYKIASVIHLCKQLRKAYPCYTFIPMYWMASEDHDFEEISVARVYGKAYVWDSPQRGRAVGRIDPRTLAALLAQIPGADLFREAYLGHSRLSDAVRSYIHTLFGAEGLLTLDADDKTLKEAFRAVILDDVMEHIPQRLVEERNAQLTGLGYTPQIHARDINFFYLGTDKRSRIERDGADFVAHEAEARWSADTMRALIDKEPEGFSPNVALRPLYQEMILPNLAYLGGPAEVAYWLQLGLLFQHYRVPFPLLLPRSFAFIMDGPTARKWQKTELDAAYLFKDVNTLHTLWMRAHAREPIGVEEEKDAVQALFEPLMVRAGRIDSTLPAAVAAEGQRAAKRLAYIEKKFIRAEKRKHADTLRQISAVKEALFPGGAPQERVENLLTFYHGDPNFVQKMIALCDPLDFRINLASYPYEPHSAT